MDLKDTSKLQRKSLNSFAEHLQYMWLSDEYDWYIPKSYKGKQEVEDHNTVSLSTMQSWHNNSFVVDGCDDLLSAANKFNFTVGQLQRAIDSKLVSDTYLKFTPTGIVCTMHKVRFA